MMIMLTEPNKKVLRTCETHSICKGGSGLVLKKSGEEQRSLNYPYLEYKTIQIDGNL